VDHSAHDVARYFLAQQNEDDGSDVTNLKLQKLCYYAQGFHLALYEQPLFGDRVKAWIHGPVIPDVWHRYREHGSAPIPPPSDFDPGVFDQPTRELLDEVQSVYGQFSPWRLRDMTHREPPWANTPQGEAIPEDAMRDYFLTQLKD